MSRTSGKDGVLPMSASELPGMSNTTWSDRSAPPLTGRGNTVVHPRSRHQRDRRDGGSYQTQRGSHQSTSANVHSRGSTTSQPPRTTLLQQGQSTQSRSISQPPTSATQPSDSSVIVLATTKKIEGYCTTIIQQQKKMLAELSELKGMMGNLQKKGFTIKNSPHELPLRKEVAKLFCTSLARYPTNDQLQRAVRKVLPWEELDKSYVVEACLKECSTWLSSFRTEERRRILGGKPVESLCHMKTEELAKDIMVYLKAPNDREVSETYTKHLALLRKYIRTDPTRITQKSFHAAYKSWVNITYPTHEVINDEWVEIMTEDTAHPYDTHPLTYPGTPPLDSDDVPGDGSDGSKPYDITGHSNPTSVNPETCHFPDVS